jgi:hypothetical protein
MFYHQCLLTTGAAYHLGLALAITLSANLSFSSTGFDNHNCNDCNLCTTSHIRFHWSF